MMARSHEIGLGREIGQTAANSSEGYMHRTDDSQMARTTTDIVFDQLYAEISSLDLPPGTRISEAEVAGRLGVSRQPVRDAFNRLGNLELLLIRPQRATEVRGFSMDAIRNARFIRLSVELEVITRASAHWGKSAREAVRANLDQQRAAIGAGEIDAFHLLDYGFHRLICDMSGFPLAFATVEQCKRSLDRLCVLSLGKANEVSAVLQDHEAIAEALASGSTEKARAAMRHHLSRLDRTIEDIRERHAEYFEDGPAGDAI